MSFHATFLEFLRTRFPLWSEPTFCEAALTPQLVSPHILRLPRAVWHKVESIAQALNQLALNPDYQTHVLHSPLTSFDPGNRAILTSLDFHLDAAGDPQLIEVNTNASFALIADALYDFHQLPHPPFLTALQKMIGSELKLNQRATDQPRMAIIDQNPSQQKLFVEFVFYKSVFDQWGWPTSIVDSGDLQESAQGLLDLDGTKIDFIYNRDTDFFLADSRISALREAYLKRQVCLSPNPHEYALLADKIRMKEWCRKDFLVGLGLDPKSIATLIASVPTTLDVADWHHDRDGLWAERKHLVFKPKSSYGAKAVYRGGSVSRTTFDTVVNDEFIAQHFVPAPTIDVAGESFKYDLRFYIYQDQVQLAIARLYQGQVTNFSHQGGGFAAIAWE